MGIATPPEEVTGDKHKIGEDQSRDSEDILADRQTDCSQFSAPVPERSKFD